MSEWRQTINKEQIISDLDEYVMEGKRAGGFDHMTSWGGEAHDQVKYLQSLHEVPAMWGSGTRYLGRGRGSSMCKGPEVGMLAMCLRLTGC